MADGIRKITTEEKIEMLKSDVEKLEDILKNRIMETYPQQIMQLDSMLHLPMFANRNLNEVAANIPKQISVNQPSRAVDSYPIGGNPSARPFVRRKLEDFNSLPVISDIYEMVTKLNPIMEELVEDAALMKNWIQSMSEMGINSMDALDFVEMDNETTKITDEKQNFKTNIENYFELRARFIAMVAKSPTINLHRQSISNLDDEANKTLWSLVLQLRLHHISIQAFLEKHLEKYKWKRICNIWGVPKTEI